MSPLREPLATFHVGHLERAGDTGAIAEQQLTARFADHRGRIELPALGVLFDHLGGIPYQLEQFKSGGFTIQARLSLSALGHIDVGDRLSCSADLATHDDQWGVTRVEIRTSTGRVCCVGSARNTVVGRSAELPTSLEDEAGGDIPDCADAHGALLPLAIEPSLPGHDIVTQLASGVRSPGPLVELLNGAVEIEGEGRDTVVRLRVRTEPWMGNMFGTMHGGIIGTILGQACSLAGQAHAAAGRAYRVGDLTASFLRSPAVQGGEVIVDVVPVKIGRRIASFSATMHSHDGMLLAAATSDIQYL